MSAAGVINAGRAAVEAFLDDSKLNAQLKGLGGRLRIAGNLAGKVGMAAVGAAAGTAIYQVKKNLEELDRVGKSARLLGMDPAELQAFSYAAEQAAGMTGEAFQKGFAKLNKGAAEAALGLGEARQVFAELGIDAAAMNNMTATDKLKTFADAFAKVEDPGKRAYMALKVFGEEGAKMGLLLSGGSKEVDRLEQKWRNLTGITGDMDTNAIERANDAMQDLQLTVSALFTKLTLDNANDLAAALEMMAAASQEFAGQSGGEGQRLMPWMADVGQVATSGVRGSMDILSGVVGDYGKTAGELFNGNFVGAIKSGGGIWINAAKTATGKLGDVYGYVTGKSKTWGETLEDTADAAANVTAATKAAAKAAEAKAAEDARIAEEAMKAAAAQDAFATSAQAVIDRLQEGITYYGKTAEEIMAIKLAAGEAGEQSAELAAELQRLIAANQELQDAKAATDAVKQMAEAFTDEALAAGHTAESLEALKVARASAAAGADPAEVEKLADAYERVQAARAEQAESEKRQQLTDDVHELTMSYIELAESIGKTTEELEEMQLQKLKDRGASDGELAAARAALAMAREARKQEAADEVTERFKTPAEKMSEELAKYKQMLDDKLISDETYARAKKELEEQAGLGSGIGTAGTMAGARLGAQFDLAGKAMAGDTAKATKELAKEQLSEAKEQHKTLKDIARAVSSPMRLQYGA